MTDGFARRKQQSKDKIRRASLELFSQFGVEKVSMGDIARKAGVSQATIYNNFESKEALSREFFAVAVDQLIDSVQAALSPQQPFRDKMKAIIRFISEAIGTKTPGSADQTLFTSSPDLRQDPEIKKIHKAANQRMTQLLLQLIQEGRTEGVVSKEISDEAFLVYFKAFMDMFTDAQLQHKFSGNPMVVEELGILMIDGLSGR